jgi:hypothetical protein
VNIKISNWAVFGLLVGIGLLIFALYRGCSNVKENAALSINYKERIRKLENDSIEEAKQRAAYYDTTEFLNVQLALSDNKLLSLTENLGKANDRIATLLKKHVPIEPNPDTNVTLVPNEYIEDCSGCFSELKNGQQLVLKYKTEKENQEKLFKSQISTKDSRINSLEIKNLQLISSYGTLLDSSQKQQSKLEQRRTLFFKMGALAINQSLPNGIGIGAMYQDKRKRIFSVGYYITEYKTVYQAEVAFPLSLRKLK